MMLPPIEKIPMSYVQPPPAPPEGPPCRTFKDTFFCGLIETKESQQRTRDWRNRMRDWEIYMRGYRSGRDTSTPPGVAAGLGPR